MLKKMFSPKQLAARHEFLTENAIRWVMYKNDPQFEKCIIRNSNRIYIIEEDFFLYLMSNSEKYKEIIRNKKKSNSNG